MFILISLPSVDIVQKYCISFFFNLDFIVFIYLFWILVSTAYMYIFFIYTVVLYMVQYMSLCVCFGRSWVFCDAGQKSDN